MEHALRDVDAHPDGEIDVVHAVSLEPVGCGETARGIPRQGVSSAAFGVVEEVRRGGAHRRPAMSGDQGSEALRATHHGRPLRSEIRAPRVRGAHVGEEEPLDLGREP